MSEQVSDASTLDTSDLRREEIEVRGRREPMSIFVFEDAKSLDGRFGESRAKRAPEPA